MIRRKRENRSRIALSIIFVLFVLYLLFLPNVSSYSYIVGVLDCNNLDNLKGCRHEIGHRMDHDLGVPSETPEFGYAVQKYMLDEFDKGNPHGLAEMLIIYPGIYKYRAGFVSTQREIYAVIYSYYEGDIDRIPEVLRPFYSRDEKYIELYECLSRVGLLNICGRSISHIRN